MLHEPAWQWYFVGFTLVNVWKQFQLSALLHTDSSSFKKKKKKSANLFIPLPFNSSEKTIESYHK